MNTWRREGSKCRCRHSLVNKALMYRHGSRRDQVRGAQRRLEVGRRASFADCSRGVEYRWENSLPLAINSRVDQKIQERRKRYRERACYTEMNQRYGYVQQQARVSAHQCYHCSRDAILRGLVARAADWKVIHEAAGTAPQRKRQSHCRDTRLYIEIEAYTQG